MRVGFSSFVAIYMELIMKQRLLSFLLILALPLIALLAVSWSVSSAAVTPATTLEVVDIGVQLTGQPSPVTAGTEIEYTVVINSDKHDVLNAITVTLDIDGRVDNLNYETDQGDFDPDSGLWSGLTLSLTSPITLTIVGAVDATAVGELTSAVIVEPVGPDDTNPDNNVAEAATPLVQQADLQVSKTAFPMTAVAGHPLTYTLSITNAGPSLATNVVLTDTLPPLTAFWT
jgi:uncharacterized repeat protein (TIGR01451 family)